MPNGDAVTNIGTPKCPVCGMVPDPPAPAIKTLKVHQCTECEHQFTVTKSEMIFTTEPYGTPP
ncbi:hypothetical protein LCGC14_0907000, partial [marine sediment metagenome]